MLYLIHSHVNSSLVALSSVGIVLCWSVRPINGATWQHNKRRERGATHTQSPYAHTPSLHTLASRTIAFPTRIAFPLRFRLFLPFLLCVIGADRHRPPRSIGSDPHRHVTTHQHTHNNNNQSTYKHTHKTYRSTNSNKQVVINAFLMSVSDPVGSTMVAAGAPQLHSTHLHPHPFEQTPLTMTDIADPHKKERTPSPEKREDGRIIDDVDGEGRIQHTREAFLINESATFEPNRTRSHTAEGSNNNTTSNAAGCSGSGSPMMAKQYLLRNRQKSGLNPESDLQPTDQIDSIQPIPTSTNSSSSSSHPLDSSNQPNVLTHWSDIRSKLVGKQLIIFLDYDGTLTPIVSQPSAAIIDQTQRERLAQLANRYPVAIVTGRKLETIKNVSRSQTPEAHASLSATQHLLCGFLTSVPLFSILFLFLLFLCLVSSSWSSSSRSLLPLLRWFTRF